MPALPDCLSSKIAASALEEDQVALLAMLCDRGQQHLFEGWDGAGVKDDRKLAFLATLAQVDRDYPGGLGGYLGTARRLMEQSTEESTPDDGVQLDSPDLVDLTLHDAVYDGMEQRGLGHLGSIAFVLVAGGLGERLGYEGIKIEVPIELTARTSYLRRYCEMIKAMENRANRESGGDHVTIPFFIMTSGGTCARTVAALEANGYFGLDRTQVEVREQHLVPSISTRDAHLVLDDPYTLQLKPNGHGDVHAQLHQHGFAKAARTMAKSHLVFIQDTNAQIVDLVLPALGASLAKDYDFNFVCVPRVAAEPLGAVVKIRDRSGERTAAIEYNVLDGFLQKLEGTGDRAAKNGLSPYPGSINLLVVKLDSYLDVLHDTGGAVAEFINPKYADDTRTAFARPTRVETLMQDLAGSYGTGARIGATLFERDWALAALKNKLETAMALAAGNQPSYSAATAESGFYANGRIKLAAAGAKIEEPEQIELHGIPFARGARVVLSPSFALTLKEAASKLRRVYLSRDAGLVIDGEEVCLEDVRLDGAGSLVVRACPGARVTVRGLTLGEPDNPIRELTPEEFRDPGLSPILQMRGYRIDTANQLVIDIDEPGDYLVGPDGTCRKLTMPQSPTSS